MPELEFCKVQSSSLDHWAPCSNETQGVINLHTISLLSMSSVCPQDSPPFQFFPTMFPLKPPVPLPKSKVVSIKYPSLTPTLYPSKPSNSHCSWFSNSWVFRYLVSPFFSHSTNLFFSLGVKVHDASSSALLPAPSLFPSQQTPNQPHISPNISTHITGKASLARGTLLTLQTNSTTQLRFPTQAKCLEWLSNNIFYLFYIHVSY